jgi:hypothetical protein
MKFLFEKKKKTYISIFSILLIGFTIPLLVEARTTAGAAQNYNECMEDWRLNVSTGGTTSQADAERSCQIQFASTIPLNADGSIKDQETPICGLSNLTQCAIDMVLLVPGYLSVIILQLAHLLVWLAGAILNYAVQYSVVNMKENIDHADSVNNAWKVIRDVSNMAFIFVLLFAAIKTIIGQGQNTQKLIVRIVVVAILMNFSLFFTRFIIDISNVIALTFYDAIAPGALMADGVNRGLSASLMEPLHLQSIMDSTTGLDGTKLFIIGVMGTIFSLIAAFVFFAVAIMFIIRFVVLIFVMVLSPIAFISFVLPEAEKFRNQWWGALSGQAFFAPVYFLLTWVVIAISRGVLQPSGSFSEAILGQSGAVGQAVAGPQSSMGVLVNFMIMIAMLVTSLVVAKDFSGKAGGAIGKITNWATGAAGGATVGLAGGLSRQTLGRAAAAIGDSQTLKDTAKKGGLLGYGATLGLKSGRYVGKSTFDLRGSGAVGGALGQAGAGKPGGKGGYAEFKKKRAEETAKFAGSLGPTDEMKDKAKRRLELAQEEAKSVRSEAEATASEQIKKPQILENLEKSIAQAEAMAKNPTISEEGRKTAAQKATDLRMEADKIRNSQEERKGKVVENLVSSSGVQNKVQMAQEKVDRLSGPSKERKAEMTDALNVEQKQAESNDPEIKRTAEKQKELEKNISALTQQVETAVGDMKTQLTTELEARKKELEFTKGEAGTRRAAIKQEFDERRKIVKDMKGIGDINKATYAEVVRNSIFAKLGGYNQAAAAKIRGGQSTQDKAAALYKEMKKDGIIKVDDEPEEKKEEGGGEEKKEGEAK